MDLGLQPSGWFRYARLEAATTDRLIGEFDRIFAEREAKTEVRVELVDVRKRSCTPLSERVTAISQQDNP